VFLDNVIQGTEISKEYHWTSAAALRDAVFEGVPAGDGIIDDNALVSVLKVRLEPGKHISRDVKLRLKDVSNKVQAHRVEGGREV
jgi:hypothetical protein